MVKITIVLMVLSLWDGFVNTTKNVVLLLIISHGILIRLNCQGKRVTSGLSYEEYRNELKLRVEQGDEEAAKALSLSNEIISYLNKREYGKQEAEGDNLLEH